MNLRQPDHFATQLLADARDGLRIFRETVGFGPHLWGNVLDVGAHHGIFGLEALASGATEVMCVEASLANYGVLLENLIANEAMGRARPLHAAAYESSARTVALRKTAGDNTGQYSVEFD